MTSNCSCEPYNEIPDIIVPEPSEFTPLMEDHLSGKLDSGSAIVIRNIENVKFIACALIGISFWKFAHIDLISSSALETLSVFITIILSLVVTSYPISIIVSVALSALVLGKSMMCNLEDGTWILCKMSPNPYNDGFRTALLGYSNPVAWMILCAFMVGKVVETTGFGRRVSLILMKNMGGSLLGLGYSVFFSEFILGPFVPSNTARGGGILMPVVMSLINSLGSTPIYRAEIGKFLILCGSHANLLVSTFFVTAAGPNLIIVHLARNIFNIEVTYANWFLGAIIPGMVCMALLPIIFYNLYSPEYNGEAVMREAENQLMHMGQMSLKEYELCGILFFALVLWMTEKLTGIPETFVAYLALITSVLFGTISWNEITSHSTGWDTFFWLSGMLVIADQLSRLEIAQFFGQSCAHMIRHLTSSTIVAALLLTFSYTISMYFFSSITGHAIAVAGPLLSAGKVMGSSPWLIVSLFACFSSLSACLTSFSTGTVVLYFSLGYFSQSEWFKIGHLVALVYLIVYSTVGLCWWMILGY